MIRILITLLLMLSAQTVTIFDFKQNTDTSRWMVVDDIVMGGVSSGLLKLNNEGNGVFEGNISLKNNGGFSLVKYSFNPIETKKNSRFRIHIKGDCKEYQFRIREKSSDNHAYVFYFQTNGNWQTIDIPFNKMYPVFRGQRLNRENFRGENLAEVGFLFGNKKAEHFRLEIDKIEIL